MLSKKDFGSYLKKIRKSKDFSVRDVGKILDISYSNLSMIENGNRNYTPALLRNLAELYNVDYLDLYEKAGYIDLIEDEKKDTLQKIGATPLSDIDTIKIPVLGSVKAGYNYLAQENIIDRISFEVDGTDIENYYALKVVGDSMDPLFSEGDTVIVHKQDYFNSGDNCIVLVNGNEATIKKVKFLDENNKSAGIKLIPVNRAINPRTQEPLYEDITLSEEEIKAKEVKIIGVVEKSIRNFKKK